VLVIYGLAEVAGTYGVPAAFAGGLAFRRYEADNVTDARVHNGAELAEKLSVILLLGSPHTLSGLGLPGWASWLLAALAIAAVRRLAGAFAFTGSQIDRPSEKTFVAWFGVRGVGSLFYAAAGAGTGVLPPGERELLVWTVIACALLSIVLHGSTAGPVDAAHAHAATCSSPGDAERSAMRSSTARSSAGWWIGSSPGRSLAATRSSAGRIVTPASNASNTRGSM
jgi:sodium/hydrogen antiporter